MQAYDFSALEGNLAYSFREKKYLLKALTHSTYAYENKERDEGLRDNERLEFLGDGLLDFVIADFLFALQADKDEGYLSKTRALVVCETTLVAAAHDIHLGDFLLLGKGEEQTGGRKKPSNLANAMEAIFAAVYMDGGFEEAKRVVLHLLSSYAQKAVSGELIFDFKSKILELSQARGNTRQVRFSIIDESGPIHERIYTAALYLDDELFSTGTGTSKKCAEQGAAKEAYTLWKTRFL